MSWEEDLKRVEGFADLGMWQEAWEVLENLSEEDSNRREFMRAGIKVAAMAGHGEVAHAIAQDLRNGDDPDRYQAACWYQALAAEQVKHGQIEVAKQLLQEALLIRPEQREMFPEEPMLNGLY
ncbi:hypothetical protein [Haloferula sp. BvORR071]|uniref:hypothetical protein n=1 Tax=Haloferula sp. BvORR071 TaxID=1396141 RepID=UPI00054D46EA|nr:hypothetical protein [Haloferula sp. BvORR071]